MNNILVTGANGQLGSEIRVLSENSKDHYFFTSSEELDVTDFSAVANYLKDNKINVIVNCAAYTAVDKAESEHDKANLVNHLAVKNLAEISKKYRIKLIHISTDYVFNGENYQPYTEDDKVNPVSVYGQTKLAGENALIEINPENSVIIRTSWVWSTFGNNFVKTMLRLGKERKTLSVVSDQVGSPTYAGDLAKAILAIIPQLKLNKVEVYHYTNEGVCSWYDFAKAVFEEQQLKVEVKSILTKDYPTPAKRPFYSVLNKQKIKERYNVEIPYWKDSLSILK